MYGADLLLLSLRPYLNCIAKTQKTRDNHESVHELARGIESKRGTRQQELAVCKLLGLLDTAVVRRTAMDWAVESFQHPRHIRNLVGTLRRRDNSSGTESRLRQQAFNSEGILRINTYSSGGLLSLLSLLI